MSRFQSMSSRLGVVIAVTSMLCALIILTTIYLFNQNMNTKVATAGKIQIEQAVSGQLIRDAQVLSATLADSLAVPLYEYDFTAIAQVIDELDKSGEIAYMYVYDAKYDVVHDGSEYLVSFGKPLSAMSDVMLSPNGTAQAIHIDHAVHVIEPISTKGVVFGGIAFGLKFSKAEQDIFHYQSKISDAYVQLNRDTLKAVFIIGLVTFFLIIIIAYVASRNLVRPLRKLAISSQDIIEHGSNISFSHTRNDEVGQLATALNEMTSRLNLNHRLMTEIAYQDELTGLSNRRHFNISFESLIKRAEINGQAFALLLIDLDKFKQVNDSVGHDAGDRLLITVAQRLKQHTSYFVASHQLDEELTLTSRLGGDEFVVVFPTDASQQLVSAYTKQLDQLMQEVVEVNSTSITGSLSIGMTLYPQHGKDATQLLKNADLAMYEAKKLGGSRTELFTFSMCKEHRLNQIIRNELQAALVDQQLYLEYQPFYSANKGKFIGAEALIRWQHPEYGLIQPELFIELLEGSPLIHDLTIWVTKQVCRDSNLLAKLGITHTLSINISSDCFTNDATSKAVAQLLEMHRNDYQTIGLELTETGMMTDFVHCRQVMNLWRSKGAQIWIDDFGTGYSSLSYLHELPIDVLKIDRSFITQLTLNKANPIVMSIFALAQTLGISVIAEGVENNIQAQSSVSLGGDILQGFLFAQPMSLNDLIKKMEVKNYVESDKFPNLSKYSNSCTCNTLGIKAEFKVSR